MLPPTVGIGQYTGPHRSSYAGASDFDESAKIGVIHSHTGSNHSHVRHAALGIIVESILIGWNLLKLAQPTAAATPGGLADVGAILLNRKHRTADGDDIGRRGWIAHPAATIARRGREGNSLGVAGRENSITMGSFTIA